MEYLIVDPVVPAATAISRAAEAILDGRVVAYPTDTLYGLAVDPHNPDAVDRLFAVKGRAEDRPIPLIAADLVQVERDVGRLTPLAHRLARVFWPGPLTLVIESHPWIAVQVHRGTGRVAVRVPDHAVARAFAARCGCAITSTSANLSGEAPVDSVEKMAAALRDRIDLLLDAGPTPGGPPSTIVDASGDHPVLVRDGVVPWNRVLECV